MRIYIHTKCWFQLILCMISAYYRTQSVVLTLLLITTSTYYSSMPCNDMYFRTVINWFIQTILINPPALDVFAFNMRPLRAARDAEERHWKQKMLEYARTFDRVAFQDLTEDLGISHEELRIVRALLKAFYSQKLHHIDSLVSFNEAGFARFKLHWADHVESHVQHIARAYVNLSAFYH